MWIRIIDSWWENYFYTTSGEFPYLLDFSRNKFALSSFWATCQGLAECAKETEFPGQPSLRFRFGVWQGIPKWGSGEKQTNKQTNK